MFVWRGNCLPMPSWVLLATICILLVSLTIAGAWGQSESGDAEDWLPPPTPSGIQMESPTAGSDIKPVSLIDLFGKLVLIGALIYAATWGLKIWQNRGISVPAGGSGSLMQVRESIPLGSSGRLYVVQFGSRNLLIATVGDQVTLLTGNSASGMDGFATSSFAAQFSSPQLASEATVGKQNKTESTRLRGESQRNTAAWERKRDALIKTLQDSVH